MIRKFLDDAQTTILRDAIFASTDPVIIDARTVGANGVILAYYNSPAVPAEKAWRPDMPARDLFIASNLTIFDSLSPGKRDSWNLFLLYAPHDLSKNAWRKVIADVWGASTADTTASFAIFTACTRDITRAEKLLGGNATASEGSGTGVVTAKRLSWSGLLTQDDVNRAMGA